MSMNNDSTMPSPLGQADTMPSRLGAAQSLSLRRPPARSGSLRRYVWLRALAAGAYLLAQYVAP
jgi:hypothetical protein